MCLIAQSCPPGDLPNPGTELGSAAQQADSLPAEPSGKLGESWRKLSFVELSKG